MTRAPSRKKAVKPVLRKKGTRRPSRRGKADPFRDLPAGHREMARDILSRTFPFTLAGLIGKSELPTAERHRPAAELARRHPDVAAAALARALGMPDLNVPDLLAHPKENPLLACDDAAGSALMRTLEKRIIAPVLRRNRGALEEIRDRLGEDEGEVRARLLHAIHGRKVLAKAVELARVQPGRAIVFLVRVAERRLLDRYRDALRVPSRKDIAPLNREDPDAADILADPAAADLLASVERGVDLPRLLGRLTPEGRRLAALMRKMADDYSDAEAAARLGVSRYAIWKLRQTMKGRIPPAS